jgi:PHP family Zn ribbon phosphoesterase
MLEPTHNDLTEEQAAKAARLIEAFLARYEAGVCPRCGTPITREIGVGQDVYAQPCGCRVGQGVARSAEELGRIRREREQAAGD